MKFKSLSMKTELENLLSDIEYISRAAAIACFHWIGRGDEKAADAAAVNAMRQAFNQIAASGTVVIGEGERDKAPMLYIGEKLGRGGMEIDIAVDPLEGTTLCAHALDNAVSVLAIAETGSMLHAPDVYMAKIAVGPGLPTGVIDLDASCAENLHSLAQAKKCKPEELCVTILNRPRHQQLIAEIRDVGAQIKLIHDGDVMGVIEIALPDAQTDMYIGIGGAPEGVLAAAALKCLGGQMQTRILFDDDIQRTRAHKMGIVDLGRKYYINDMVGSDVLFAVTGVTNGLLHGVKATREGFSTHSLIMSSRLELLKYIETTTL